MSNNNELKSSMVMHSNCPDGAAAAIIAKKINANAKIVYGLHSSVNEQVKNAAIELPEDGFLWIADICCDERILEEASKIIRKKNGKLGVYEHHQTRDWLANYSLIENLTGEVVFDNHRCGSKIFFEAMSEKYPEIKEYSEFIAAINDRDLWINENDNGALMAKLHNVYGDVEFINRFVNNPSLELSHDEALLIDYQDKKDLKKMEKLLERIELGRDENGFEYGIIYGEAVSSDLLNMAIVQCDLEYAILINLNAKHGSIRSRGSFDCAAFSEKRGGGGHKCASGFKLDFRNPKVMF